MQLLLVTMFSALLVGALAAWYAQIRRGRTKPYDDGTPSYLRRESLLLDHEQRYFQALNKVVGGHARVFAKVRLSDLVQPQEVNGEQRTHWMRVQRRCVDFLLCSPNNLAPVLAIDLDTRLKKRRREQSPGGDVLDNALKTADIPLLRVRASRDYSPHEVRQQVRFALAVSEEPVSEWFRETAERHEPWWRPWWRRLESWLPTFARWTSGLRSVLHRA